MSIAPVVIVAVYSVPDARTLDGVNVAVAVAPAYPTSPETAVVPSCKVKFAIVIVEGSIPTLKIAEILLLMAILVASVIGSVEVTLGGTTVVITSFLLQPAINTTNSFAMIRNTFFLSFMLVYFNYFKM